MQILTLSLVITLTVTAHALVAHAVSMYNILYTFVHLGLALQASSLEARPSKTGDMRGALDFSLPCPLLPTQPKSLLAFTMFSNGVLRLWRVKYGSHFVMIGPGCDFNEPI